MSTNGMAVLRMIRCSWTTMGSEWASNNTSPSWDLEPDVERSPRKLPSVLPGGVVMQCHAEDSHWTGMDRNLVLAEKQYSVLYSMSLYLYRSEFTMMWLCGKHIVVHWHRGTSLVRGTLNLPFCCDGCCVWKGCTSSGGTALPCEPRVFHGLADIESVPSEWWGRCCSRFQQRTVEGQN